MLLLGLSSVFGPLFFVVLAALTVWLLTRWIVNVGGTEIAILERRFIGQELEAGRAFATGGEVGIQARYLAPGLHFIPWPLVRVR